FIVIVAVVMILGELNLNIGPAIAGLGIVGIAVGFGAQSLVKDYFNGALILLENQYSKGDVVTIADTTGTVEDFSLRRTTLRDLDGVVHSVPNGQVTVASNRTRTWARINQDVTVAYGTDLEKATLVIDDVGRDMAADPVWRRRVLEAPHVERIEALGEYGVTIKILGLVRAPEKWAAGGELRKRLLTAFAANGIEIPRPQRVVLAPSGQPTVEPVAGPTQDELSVDSD
ncbi:MAG TPA: mechanosensitive ion channel family protein, partial [Candidatus Limnocylindrales bacterium]